MKAFPVVLLLLSTHLDLTTPQRLIAKREAHETGDFEVSNCPGNGRVPDGGCRIHKHVTLPHGYDINEVPEEENGGPVVVKFSINLANILAIDEPKQVISVETTLRLGWTDGRINVSLPTFPNGTVKPPKYLLFNRDPIKYFWFPDVFVDRAKDLRVPVYKIPPAYLRMFEGGGMLYSARVNYDVACPMNFENYPLDVQNCEIIFESWGTNIDKVLFEWRVNDSKINQDITLNQHEFEVEFSSTLNDEFSTGVFPRVVLHLKLKRKLSYHMLRTYLPSSLFVTLAWFSMFIPLEHVPGRVTMGMTALLTLASMFGSLSTITPPISYTTKLDVWMVGCIVFVFATLAEFTVVIFLKYYLADVSDVVGVSGIMQAWEASSAEKRRPPPPRLQDSLPFARQFMGGGATGPAHRKRSFFDGAGVKRPKTSSTKVEDISIGNNGVIVSRANSNGNDGGDKSDGGDEGGERGEKIILAIEKFSVFIFLFSFLGFNVFYWIDIMNLKGDPLQS